MAAKLAVLLVRDSIGAAVSLLSLSLCTLSVSPTCMSLYVLFALQSCNGRSPLLKSESSRATEAVIIVLVLRIEVSCISAAKMANGRKHIYFIVCVDGASSVGAHKFVQSFP